MPNVFCPSCGLTSYVAAPHSGQPLGPHCDGDLRSAVARPPLSPVIGPAA